MFKLVEINDAENYQEWAIVTHSAKDPCFIFGETSHVGDSKLYTINVAHLDIKTLEPYYSKEKDYVNVLYNVSDPSMGKKNTSKFLLLAEPPRKGISKDELEIYLIYLRGAHDFWAAMRMNNLPMIYFLLLVQTETSLKHNIYIQGAMDMCKFFMDNRNLHENNRISQDDIYRKIKIDSISQLRGIKLFETIERYKNTLSPGDFELAYYYPEDLWAMPGWNSSAGGNGLILSDLPDRKE